MSRLSCPHEANTQKNGQLSGCKRVYFRLTLRRMVNFLGARDSISVSHSEEWSTFWVQESLFHIQNGKERDMTYVKKKTKKIC